MTDHRYTDPPRSRDELDQRVAELLAREPWAPLREIADGVGLKRSERRHASPELVVVGAIERLRQPSRRRPGRDGLDDAA